MPARMKNPAYLLPGVAPAMQALGASLQQAGVPARTFELMHLRASQINGCSVCVDLHARQLQHAHETTTRMLAVTAWRDSPEFSEAERAALALTEAVTRLSDRSDPVPDEIWNEAARHYDEPALVALVVTIASINFWNRINVSTRQVAGEWAKSAEARAWMERQAAS